jgi:hypothetical protein
MAVNQGTNIASPWVHRDCNLLLEMENKRLRELRHQPSYIERKKEIAALRERLKEQCPFDFIKNPPEHIVLKGTDENSSAFEVGSSEDLMVGYILPRCDWYASTVSEATKAWRQWWFRSSKVMSDLEENTRVEMDSYIIIDGKRYCP